MNKKTASMFLFIFRISWILHSVHFNFAPLGFFSIFSRNYSVFPRKWHCRWWGVVVSVNGDERNGGGVNKARKVSSGDSNLHCCFSYHSVNFCLFLVQQAIYRFGKVCFVPQKMSERKSTFPSYVYLILFKPTLLILLSCTHSLCVHSCILLRKRE